MVLDIIRYVELPENGEAGQNSNGKWYCKKLPFKDEHDLDQKISKINKVLNKYNNEVKK